MERDVYRIARGRRRVLTGWSARLGDRGGLRTLLLHHESPDGGRLELQIREVIVVDHTAFDCTLELGERATLTCSAQHIKDAPAALRALRRLRAALRVKRLRLVLTEAGDH